AIMSRLGFLHSPGTAQLREYHEPYVRWAMPDARMHSHAELVNALGWGLVTCHGVAPTVLSTCIIRDGQGDEAEPVLDLVTARLWWPLPRIGYSRSLSRACAEVSRPGSDWASILLAPRLQTLARKIAGCGIRVAGATLDLLTDPVMRRQAQRLARST